MHELWAADFRSWLLINPAVIEILSDLRAGGTRTGAAVQRRRRLGSYFRHGPLGDFFEACYVSGELGLIKPQPEIFLHVLADLSITPAEAIFIDNRESNVAGAEALGITGHVFTTADALRSFLTSAALPIDYRPARVPGGVACGASREPGGGVRLPVRAAHRRHRGVAEQASSRALYAAVHTLAAHAISSSTAVNKRPRMS